MQNSSEMDHWLTNLDRSLSESKQFVLVQGTPNTYHFRYLLSPTTSYSHAPSLGIKVEITYARTLKSGKTSVYKRFIPSMKSQQDLLDETTRELLMELKGMQSFYKGNSYYQDDGKYELLGQKGEEILIKLVKTGFCCWSDAQTTYLHLGPEKRAEWHWQLSNNDGVQSLHCHREKNRLYLFAVEHVWYCNEKTGEIGIMQTGIDRPTLPMLLSLAKVPMEQAKKVSLLLKKHQDKFPIEQPKVPLQESETVEPLPCLRLFQVPIKKSRHGRSWDFVTVLEPALEVTFDYHGHLVSSVAEQDFLYYLKDDQLFSIKRDTAKEDAYIEIIAKVGWALPDQEEEGFFKQLRSSAPPYFLLDLENYDPVEFSAFALPQLKEQGWRINIAKDYPYQVVNSEIEEWYSSLDETSSYDWFGLELGITLEGEKINLLPVLQKILQKLKTDKLSSSSQPREDLINKEIKSVFAQLPNGHYLKLPAERLRNILNIFIELYDSESLTKNNKLRLSKLHAARLQELEKAMGAAQLRWIGGDRLRKMGKKLSEFRGIETVQAPSGFQGELRPYQIEGLSWLQFLREYDLSGILADDMGLGKTVQALAHLQLEKISGRMQRPCLIVAPTSLMFNWQMEAERFTPDLKVLLLHGALRKNLVEEISSHDLILTTYPLIARDKEILLNHDFYYLILDEAQYIKNSQTKAAQIALQLKTQHRLCLTGTPMENHLGELWSLFHFMMPGLLGERKQFTQLFRTPIEKHADHERRTHLNRRIAPFLLRRTKDKVMEELPEKVEMIRHIELDGPQRDLYETIRVSMQKKVKKHVAELGLNRSHIFILDALLKLRQVCCDPRLLKIATAQKEKVPSAKLELLMSLLTELLSEGRRILLFSQFTEMLALIEKELHEKTISYVKLTGQTQDRKTPVQQFQEGNVPLFLISLKAGGTGLNLTAADTVIHYDPWWNPAVENQATDRAHRIGQSKTVFVYKLVTKGTVEEKILEMQQNKHALMEGLFSGTESKFKMTDKDLQSLFDPLE
ncbi:MAG: DEAD/DEAH box helicase [Chthoniobacterales bacterium]